MNIDSGANLDNVYTSPVYSFALHFAMPRGKQGKVETDRARRRHEVTDVLEWHTPQASNGRKNPKG